MLQANEIQRRFFIVERAIGEAAQACSAERDVPSELRDCIQRLDRQSDLAREAIQSRDELRIRKGSTTWGNWASAPSASAPAAPG